MANTTVDTLLIKIQADMQGLRRELNSIQKKTQSSTSKMAKHFDKVDRAQQKLRKGLLLVGSAIAGAFVVKKIANVSAEFEDLGLTLATVFKGVEQGQAAIDFINQFAQRTPFDIQTLTKSFIQLGGAGIKPTEKLLTTLGDAASATVNRMQTFESLTRIVTRAVGGGLGLEELEQLVSAGIPVYKILNDEIGVTRQEISAMGQTAEGAEKIMNALLTGLDKEFGGGMERSAQNLSVAFSNLGIAATNVTKSMGDEFNDSLTDLTNEMSRLLENLKPVAEMIGKVLDFGIGLLAKGFRELNDAIGGEKGTNDSLKELEDKLGENVEAMKKSKKASEEFTKSQETLDEQIKLGELSLAGYNEEFAKLLISAGKSADAMVMTKDTMSDIKFDEADKEVEELAYKFRRLHDIQKDLEKINLAESVIEENEALDENAQKIEALLFLLERFPERKEEIEKALRSLNPFIQSFENVMTDAFENVGNVIADSMTEGANAMEGLKEVARNTVNALIKEFYRLTILEPLKKAIFGKGGFDLGGLLGGSPTPVGTITSASSGFSAGGGISSAFSSVRPFAGGGAVSPNVPTIVGERGAELFVPNTSGRIVNNANMRGMGGGTTVINQNLNVETGVSQTVRAEMLNLLPVFKQETMIAVAESRLRGGEFASAFTGGK